MFYKEKYKNIIILIPTILLEQFCLYLSELTEFIIKTKCLLQVKVVKYQDELESQRCEDIPAQVEKYRASLLKQMEEKLDALNEQKDKKKKKGTKR